MLVENIECDSRVDDNECSHFTLFHIYAFAAKVPPSGAGVSLAHKRLVVNIVRVLSRDTSLMNHSLLVAMLSLLRIVLLNGQH